MTDAPLLWRSGARKEVMALLRRLWTSGDATVRARLSDLVTAGPPEALLVRLDAEQRQSSRDRRIYDRLMVLERLSEPPLTEALRAELDRLRVEYPEWRAPDGERADFSAFMEFRVGPETDVTVEGLARLPAGELVAKLTETRDLREGLLDVWREFAAGHPSRALDLLQEFPAEPHLSDVWVHGLWGVRDKAGDPEIRGRLLGMLVDLPEPLLGDAEVTRAAADVLQVVAKVRPLLEDYGVFWDLFDRLLGSAARDPDNAEIAENNDWVFLAINRSMGSLASALLDALFGRKLVVGQGLPDDIGPRLERLLSYPEASHRPARVIAASRLSYLFAVDPAWTAKHLLPRFDWRDETESIAVWHGFGWQPRIDERLWEALKNHFLLMFTPQRLAALSEGSASQMAALLMLAGIEFPDASPPREGARDAIRAMSDRMRAGAAAWVADYLRQQAGLEPGEGEILPVDEAWTKRVGPWLSRVWPPELEGQAGGAASQFARAVVAVDEAFPDALRVLSPFLHRGAGDMVLHELAASDHPDRHPRETVNLLDRVVDLNRLWMADDLRDVLNRVVAADAALADDHIYHRLDERLRAAGL